MKITFELSPDDAERLLKAFQDGKLAELGVTDVELELKEEDRGGKRDDAGRVEVGL